MPKVSFFIPGPIGSKQSTIQGRNYLGQKVFYTKQKSANYENLVKQYAYQAMEGLPPAEEWVQMDVQVFFPIPESWSGKKKTQAMMGLIKPTVRPDRDNIVKVLQDGMNAIVYKDDKQVTDGNITKRYAEKSGVQIDVYWER